MSACGCVCVCERVYHAQSYFIVTRRVHAICIVDCDGVLLLYREREYIHPYGDALLQLSTARARVH